jgi:group I intron endonuclease
MGVSGIYKITNTVNGRCYYGSAINLERRKIDHWKDLRGNRHGNGYLQRAWNKYGEDAFDFSVIEVVPVPENLIPREQVYLDKAFLEDSLRPYNICRVAGSQLGTKRDGKSRAKMSAAAMGKVISDAQRSKMSATMSGRKRTPEHEEKLAATRRGKKKSAEFCRKIGDAKRGHKQSPETIEKRAAKLRGRKMPVEYVQKLSDLHRSLTKEQVAEIVARRKAGETYVDIAKDYNTTKDTIRNWCMREGGGKNYDRVMPEALRQEIFKLRSAGKSLRYICEKCRVGKQTVLKVYQEGLEAMPPTPTSPDRPAPAPLPSHPDQLSLL